ncbi:hypothetical protein J7E70_32680 [Variovorax paradoxus]|nr:hypothetical protein [Variovorax paradoxus]MBT2305164.1 hypothetical protein [Variovorax paradoxus]
MAGAAAGLLAGPAGAAAGLDAGGIVGGLCGKAVAERVNPTGEIDYWRERYADEPYYEAGRTYEDYRPAYQLGWSTRAAAEGTFDLVEPAMAAQWGALRGNSRLDWAQARAAARAAWDRADSTRFAEGDPDDSVDPGEVSDQEGIVEMLNALLGIVRDSGFGFQACADEVGAPKLRQVFRERAEQCHRAASVVNSWDSFQRPWRRLDAALVGAGPARQVGAYLRVCCFDKKEFDATGKSVRIGYAGRDRAMKLLEAGAKGFAAISAPPTDAHGPGQWAKYADLEKVYPVLAVEGSAANDTSQITGFSRSA